MTISQLQTKLTQYYPEIVIREEQIGTWFECSEHDWVEVDVDGGGITSLVCMICHAPATVYGNGELLWPTT